MRFGIVLAALLVSSTSFAAADTTTWTCKSRKGPWARFQITLPTLDNGNDFPDSENDHVPFSEVVVKGNFRGNLAIEKYEDDHESPEIWEGNVPSWKLKVKSQTFNKIVASTPILSDFGFVHLDIGLDETDVVSVLVDYNSDAATLRAFYTCKK